MPEDTPESIFTEFQPQQSPIAQEPPKRQRKTSSKKAIAPDKTPKKETAAPAAPARKKRKPRTVPKVRVPRGLRFTLAESLAIMDTLKPEDAAVFEKLVGILGGANKKQRERVLAALKQVFA